MEKKDTVAPKKETGPYFYANLVECMWNKQVEAMLRFQSRYRFRRFRSNKRTWRATSLSIVIRYNLSARLTF